MKKDRTNYDIEVEFTHPETGETVSTFVYIPFEIFVETVRKYCEIKKDVVLDGTDVDIWNLFVEIDGAFDTFMYDDDFVDICREKYDNSYYKEEDFEEWKDEYDFDHEIGEYTPSED